MKKMYYSLEQNGDVAHINIYGDITSYAGKNDLFGDEIDGVSAVNLSKKLAEIGDVSQINVYINSYGGEVAEGLAIYNALKRHNAKIKTYCDGFACSIASVIFMAGDERIMNESSLLMIHNAWTYAVGNSEELRKQADDLEKITQASVEAYKAHSELSEEEIKNLMDAETWILPAEALEYGFATSVLKSENAEVSQSARMRLFDIIKAHQAETDPEDTDEDEEQPETDTEETPTDEGEDTEEEETDDNSEEETPETNEEGEEKPLEKINKFFNAILKI